MFRRIIASDCSRRCRRTASRLEVGLGGWKLRTPSLAPLALLYSFTRFSPIRAPGVRIGCSDLARSAISSMACMATASTVHYITLVLPFHGGENFKTLPVGVGSLTVIRGKQVPMESVCEFYGENSSPSARIVRFVGRNSLRNQAKSWTLPREVGLHWCKYSELSDRTKMNGHKALTQFLMRKDEDSPVYPLENPLIVRGMRWQQLPLLINPSILVSK